LQKNLDEAYNGKALVQMAQMDQFNLHIIPPVTLYNGPTSYIP
jgi:hypothetical protein